MSENVRAEWRTASGAIRKLVLGTFPVVLELDVRDGKWRAIHPDRVGLADVLALLSDGPRSQDTQIDQGTLEGCPIPPALLGSDDRFREELKAWCRSRRERGKKVTKTSAGRTLKKLEGMGRESAIRALKAAADAGWTSVYEVREDARGQKPLATEHREGTVAAFRGKISR